MITAPEGYDRTLIQRDRAATHDHAQRRQPHRRLRGVGRPAAHARRRRPRGAAARARGARGRRAGARERRGGLRPEHGPGLALAPPHPGRGDRRVLVRDGRRPDRQRGRPAARDRRRAGDDAHPRERHGEGGRRRAPRARRADRRGAQRRRAPDRPHDRVGRPGRPLGDGRHRQGADRPRLRRVRRRDARRRGGAATGGTGADRARGEGGARADRLQRGHDGLAARSCSSTPPTSRRAC